MKIVIVVLCMNVLLYYTGVRLLDTTEDYMSDLVVTGGNQSNLTLASHNGSLLDATEDMSQLGKSGGGFIEGVVNFIDTLGAVGDFVRFIVNITLTPFGLLRGLPPPFPLMIGLPLFVIGVLSVAYFIRSGN